MRCHQLGAPFQRTCAENGAGCCRDHDPAAQARDLATDSTFSKLAELACDSPFEQADSHAGKARQLNSPAGAMLESMEACKILDADSTFGTMAR